jgi:hypothetical protein
MTALAGIHASTRLLPSGAGATSPTRAPRATSAARSASVKRWGTWSAISSEPDPTCMTRFDPRYERSSARSAGPRPGCAAMSAAAVRTTMSETLSAGCASPRLAGPP